MTTEDSSSRLDPGGGTGAGAGTGAGTGTGSVSGNASGYGAGQGAMTVALVVVLGSVMTVLDMTIVNVALNRLAQGFHSPLATIQWVVTAYTLALATVIPLTAWGIGRFGTKRLFLLSVTLFVLGSALAGLAWSAASLIAFRVVQGLGGGMIVPVGMTIVIRASDQERLGRMMSVLGLPVLIGPLAGPILGGWLVDEVSWRWLFLINLPIGALALLLAARIFPYEPARPAHRLDVPGMLMLSPGLAALIYGLATGSERGGFGSAGALLPAAGGAALVLGFIARALTVRHPLVELRLFRRRPFAAGAGALTLFACAYFGSMLLLPLYYQLVRGQSAMQTGLLGIPQALATGITMQVAGRLVDRIAPGKLVLAGAGLASAGFCGFATQVTADAPYWALMSALAVMGVGVGCTIMPTMTAVTRNLSHEEVPVATTALNITQQLAASVGTALVSVLLAGQMARRLPVSAGGGEGGEGSEGSLGAVRELSPDAVARIAPRLADAFQHTYAWAVALMAAALLPILLLPRRRGPEKEAAAKPEA